MIPKDKTKNPPVGMRSYEASILIDTIQERLDHEEYGLIPYGVLSDACGMNVQKQPGRGRLDTAIRHFLSQHSIRLEKVYNEGLRKLTKDECIQFATVGRRRVNRTAKRERRKFVKSLPNLELLSNAEKIMYNAERASFEMLTHLSDQKAYKAIEKKTEEQEKLLSMRAALKAFIENGK